MRTWSGRNGSVKGECEERRPVRPLSLLVSPLVVIRRLPLLALCGVLLGLAACDSGDAVDPPTPADVAGTYDIQALRFVPDGTGIAAVNVLDTLVVAESFVRILDGGQAQLEFRRRGGTSRFVSGTVEVRARQVRMTFDAADDATLARLVIPRVLTFDRDGNNLAVVDEELTANLEAYDAARYPNLTAVEGELTVRLALRADA